MYICLFIIVYIFLCSVYISWYSVHIMEHKTGRLPASILLPSRYNLFHFVESRRKYVCDNLQGQDDTNHRSATRCHCRGTQPRVFFRPFTINTIIVYFYLKIFMNIYFKFIMNTCLNLLWIHILCNEYLWFNIISFRKAKVTQVQRPARLYSLIRGVCLPVDSQKWAIDSAQYGTL